MAYLEYFILKNGHLDFEIAKKNVKHMLLLKKDILIEHILTANLPRTTYLAVTTHTE